MYPKKIEAFQIAISALPLLLPHEIEVKSSGKLPKSAFSWTYGNVTRINVMVGAIDVPMLQKWVANCNALGVVPVFLYSTENLDDHWEDIDFLSEEGMVVVWVTPENVLHIARGDDDEDAPLPTRIMQPDESVVCRYLGAQDLLALNAWDINDDLQFWFAYGKALTAWKANTTEQRWKRLEMQLREEIADKYGYSNATFSMSDKKTRINAFDGDSSVTYSSDLPFIHDVRKGTAVKSYGRIPLFDVSLPMVPVSTPASAMSALAIEALAFPAASLNRLLGAEKISTVNSGTAPLKPKADPLVPSLRFLNALKEYFEMVFNPPSRDLLSPAPSKQEPFFLPLIVKLDHFQKLNPGDQIGTVYFHTVEDRQAKLHRKLEIKFSSIPIDAAEVEVTVKFPNIGLTSPPTSPPVSYRGTGVRRLIDIEVEFSKTNYPDVFQDGAYLAGFQDVTVTIGDREIDCVIWERSV